MLFVEFVVEEAKEHRGPQSPSQVPPLCSSGCLQFRTQRPTKRGERSDMKKVNKEPKRQE